MHLKFQLWLSVRFVISCEFVNIILHKISIQTEFIKWMQLIIWWTYEILINKGLLVQLYPIINANHSWSGLFYFLWKCDFFFFFFIKKALLVRNIVIQFILIYSDVLRIYIYVHIYFYILDIFFKARGHFLVSLDKQGWNNMMQWSKWRLVSPRKMSRRASTPRINVTWHCGVLW